MKRIPATSKEKALWLLDRLVPGTGLNNVSLAVQVDGRLRQDALATSIDILLGRYETLRTVYFAAGADLTKELVPDGVLMIDIERVKLSGGPPEKDLSEFTGRPFEMDGRPLLRVGVASHPDGDIFCLVAHHLVFDVTSCAVFLRALIPVYEAVLAGLPLPPAASAPVPAFAEAEPAEADLAYWRDSLRGFVPDGLDLWCGVSRARHPLMTGDSVRHTLSGQAQLALRGLQREVRAPVAPLLLAAYYALLVAHGAGPDLVVGTPLSLRGPQAPASIGYHVNVVPLRLRVDLSESFRQLVRRTRDLFLAAMAHANVSVDDLSAELPRVGSSWQTTLYRHMFNYLPGAGSAELVIDGMAARTMAAENGFSKFDLELFAMPSTAEIWFRYCTEILARADVEALLGRYEALLIAVGAEPDRPLAEFAGWSEHDREVIDAANAAGWRLSGPAAPGSGPAGGWPVAGTRASVIAPDGRELPIGVRGELCIAGGAGDAQSVSRTGQLARWQPDGTLALLGRAGRQAVIAGSPVNLDEVAAALLSHDGVRAAAAVAVPAPGGDLLVAFAEAAGDLAEQLRAHALACLPPAAVPERVICVPELPRDQDGAVDHAALGMRIQAYLDGGSDAGAPAADDPLVQDLMRLWRQLLDVEVTPRTIFFAAGGHSLLAAKLAQDVEELTGIYIELSEIFNYPTPSALAARLGALAAGSGAAPARPAAIS
jgi:acyl carrier protein